MYVVHTLTFLPKNLAPSDRRVTQNGENDDQCSWQRQECTFLPDKIELLRVVVYTLVDYGTQLVHYSLPDRQPV